MAYTPQTWTDAPSTATPVSAARLTNMENGIAAASVTDPWLLRRTHIGANPQRRTFWGNKADTTTPSTVEDTGQTGVKYSTSAFPMKVLNGKLTFGPTGTTVFDYRYFGDAAPLTQIGARFTFDSTGGKTTTNGSVTLAIMNDDLDNQSSTAFRMAVHLTVTPTRISMDTGTNATNTMVFTPLLLRNFSSALPMDGKTVHTLDLFRVGTTVTILAPDGNMDVITDANIGAFAGNYGFHELTANSTDVLPSYVETWSGTGTQYPPTNQFMTNSMMRNHDAETRSLYGATFGDKLDITSVTPPAAPAAGMVRFFARQGTSGLDAPAWTNNLGFPIVIGRDTCFFARNNTGATITKGSAVYSASASGTIVNMAKAQADATMTKIPVIGIVCADILNGQFGTIMQYGVIQNLNTSGLTAGAAVYLDPTTPGALTSTPPTHPNVAEGLGLCINTSASVGSLLVNVDQHINARNQGVNGASFSIGDGTGSGAKTVNFKNANTGTLTWTPTAARTITLPDGTGTVYISGGALGTPASGTLTNCTALPVSGITASTATALGVGSVELGHASDTTLTRSAAGRLAVEGVNVALDLVTANFQTASYTLVLTDASKAVEMNVASANDITVPPNSSVAFPVGTVIEVFQIGAGQTTIVAGAGVTLRSAGTKLKLTGQYSTASLRKRASDEWVLTGDVTA